MKNKILFYLFFLPVLFFSISFVTSFSQVSSQPSGITKVVFLGTGNPNPDPNHSGNSIAILVKDTPYIIDFGPGLIRQAATLSTDYGGPLKALNSQNIKRAFLTHLHSDHTTGFPDLILTPWVMGRNEPLQVYGPEGTKAMAKNIIKAYQEDIRIRLYGREPANNQGWRVIVHEFKQGIIYKDENVTVEAFKVDHGSWPEAYGFKFITADRTIAISGDTRPCENLIRKCKEVDVLIHEVYSLKKLKGQTPFWQKYHPLFHTSTVELAEIARQVQPGLLILYHQLPWGATDAELVAEITDIYKGKVVSAKDLDIF
jgi:ribonuclease Z